MIKQHRRHGVKRGPVTSLFGTNVEGLVIRRNVVVRGFVADLLNVLSLQERVSLWNFGCGGCEDPSVSSLSLVAPAFTASVCSTLEACTYAG